MFSQLVPDTGNGKSKKDEMMSTRGVGPRLHQTRGMLQHKVRWKMNENDVPQAAPQGPSAHENAGTFGLGRGGLR